MTGYLLYRFTMFAFNVGNTIWFYIWREPETRVYTLIYLTMQGILFLTFHDIVQFTLVTVEYVKQRKGRDLNEKMTWGHKFAWIVSNINCTLAPFITVFYWSFLDWDRDKDGWTPGVNTF